MHLRLHHGGIVLSVKATNYECGIKVEVQVEGRLVAFMRETRLEGHHIVNH